MSPQRKGWGDKKERLCDKRFEPTGKYDFLIERSAEFKNSMSKV